MNMFEKAYKDFEGLKPSEKAVDRAVQSALNALGTSEEKYSVNFFGRKKLLVAMAACLVFVFACTFVLGLQRNTTEPFAKEKYSFSINANAAQATLMGENPDSSVIGAYSSELSGGWGMYQNLEKNSDVSPSYFQSYCMNYLNIEGRGIKSVTFKANTEGTYFAISPEGYYKTVDTSDNIAEKEAEKYTDLSLNNSVYSSEELSQYKDGLSFGNVYCDTFTYQNADATDSINLSCKIEYVIESSHSNTETTDLLDKLWLYEEKITEEKMEDVPSRDKLNTLYLELSDMTEELQRMVLKDATVDIIVKFADGSEQTKTLNMGLTRTEDSGLWLVVSE